MGLSSKSIAQACSKLGQGSKIKLKKWKSDFLRQLKRAKHAWRLPEQTGWKTGIAQPRFWLPIS